MLLVVASSQKTNGPWECTDNWGMHGSGVPIKDVKAVRNMRTKFDNVREVSVRGVVQEHRESADLVGAGHVRDPHFFPPRLEPFLPFPLLLPFGAFADQPLGTQWFPFPSFSFVL